MNSEAKSCAKCQVNFTITPDDASYYEKIGGALNKNKKAVSVN